MIAPDGISPLTRYAALVAEVPVIQLAEPVARELGLRDGQVIQGVIQARGDELVFEFSGRFLGLPPSLMKGAPGDLRWFRVIRQGAGLALRPLSPHLSPSTGSADPVRPATSPSTAAALASSEPLPTARHAALLAPHGGLSSLNELLSPGWLESELLDAGEPELAQALALSRLRVEALSAQSVQQAVSRSGFWTEAMLAMGRAIPAQDNLKSLLRQIGRALVGRSSGAAADVEDAIDQIERRQLDSVQSQTDGRFAISMMLPFADAEPAVLRFERQGGGGRSARSAYTIDLHIAPPALGDLWVKTLVDGDRVDVTVWTQRSIVAAMAESAGADLESELQEAGLRLRAFRVLEGARPDIPPGPAAAGASLLDLKA